MASSLASAVASDPALRIALWIGAGAFVLTLLLLLLLIALRQLLRWRLRERASFISRWRPLMMDAILDEDISVPRLAARHQIYFLVLWNEFRESVRGAAERGLNSLACAVGADHAARRLLAHGNGGERLLALLTLGRLGQPVDRDRVLQVVQEDDPYVSLSAARALILIDPMQAVRDLLPLVARRSDWPSAKIVAIIGEAGADTLSPLLATFLRRVPETVLPRLLPLLAEAHIETAAPILDKVLTQAKQSELIISALKLVRTPQSINVVRRLLHHEDWCVRTQAASAMGRIGASRDMDLLAPLLCDREWWVRYRAGQALVCLPGVSIGDMQLLHNSLQDGFARDMLIYAAGEAGVTLLASEARQA